MTDEKAPATTRKTIFELARELPGCRATYTSDGYIVAYPNEAGTASAETIFKTSKEAAAFIRGIKLGLAAKG